MSEWQKIENQLANGVEDLYEECLVLWEDKMNRETDGAWSRFVAECKARYEAGRKEHEASSSTWEAWSDDEFAANIREELMDFVIYSAARSNRILTRHARR